jgi:hypothetical protein
MEACYREQRTTASVSTWYEFVANMRTMTPKLKLNDDARKTLLSCILKFLLLGIKRTRISMQIMLAPRVQAVQCYCLVSKPCTRPLTNPAHGTHNPASSIIVHMSRHNGREAVAAVTLE